MEHQKYSNFSTNLSHSKSYPFNLFFQNIRGINTKFITIHNFLHFNCYDIFALTETWLTCSSNIDSIFHPTLLLIIFATIGTLDVVEGCFSLHIHVLEFVPLIYIFHQDIMSSSVWL